MYVHVRVATCLITQQAVVEDYGIKVLFFVFLLFADYLYTLGVVSIAHRKATVFEDALFFGHDLADILFNYCVLLLWLFFALFSLQNKPLKEPPVEAEFCISLPPPGLKAGDEILMLNGKPASALQMDDMRAAFVDQALTLSVSTLPQLDPRVLCSIPPRRSDGEQDLATDIFSQDQGEGSCPT